MVWRTLIVLSLVLSCQLGRVAGGQEPNGTDMEKPRDFLDLVNTEHDKRLILAIRELAKKKEKAAVPLLHEVFLKTPRSERAPYAAGPVRGEALKAIAVIGGDDARWSLRDIVDLYLTEGSRTEDLARPRLNYPFDDDEYAYVMSTAWPPLLALADKSLEEWFLKVAENQRYSMYIREPAYHGYLKAQLDRLRFKSVEEATRYILKDLTSGGDGEWDYYNHPIKDTDPAGKQDFAIRDSARIDMMMELGPAALPVLQAEWDRLNAKKDKPLQEQRRMYGIASTIMGIYEENKLPNPPKLERRSPDAEAQWKRESEAHRAKVKEYLKSQGLPVPQD